MCVVCTLLSLLVLFIYSISLLYEGKHEYYQKNYMEKMKDVQYCSYTRFNYFMLTFGFNLRVKPGNVTLLL